MLISRNDKSCKSKYHTLKIFLKRNKGRTDKNPTRINYVCKESRYKKGLLIISKVDQLHSEFWIQDQIWITEIG